MSKYNNLGNVNIEALKTSFTSNGGTIESKKNTDGSTHYTGHFNDKGRKDRCSWDEDKDGNISNVHTTRDNGDHTTYGGGQRLLEKMKDYFVDQECASVRLLVLSDNTNAVDFYKKSGFIPHDLEMVMKI